jgi:uncharacterized protein (DUF1501 family)
MKRREFVQMLGAGSATLLTGRLYAAPTSGPRLLLVFLRGGYDCANLLVPYSSSDYYELRPHIAVPRPDPALATGAMALDADWALAPAVRDTIGGLYTKHQALFIPFAGTDDLSRSHFETQDSIELGQPTQGKRDFRSGFLARLCAVLTGPAPIAFTDALPLCFTGGSDVPNVSLKGVAKPVFDERQAALLVGMYAGNPLQPAIADGLELRQQVAQTMAQEMAAANRGAINPKGFELEAERMGHLMRDKYRIGFIDVGGWDTHVGEGAAQGALASNLASLGRGLQAFSQSMGSDWDNTVVVVLSEFGRTFRENGNHGTDHGHGSVHWVMGGAISGGRIVGEQQPLERVNLFQDRDYPVLNDYRTLLADLFRSMWGLSDAQGSRIFPQTTPARLNLV